MQALQAVIHNKQRKELKTIALHIQINRKNSTQLTIPSPSLADGVFEALSIACRPLCQDNLERPRTSTRGRSLSRDRSQPQPSWVSSYRRLMGSGWAHSCPVAGRPVSWMHSGRRAPRPNGPPRATRMERDSSVIRSKARRWWWPATRCSFLVRGRGHLPFSWSTRRGPPSGLWRGLDPLPKSHPRRSSRSSSRILLQIGSSSLSCWSLTIRGPPMNILERSSISSSSSFPSSSSSSSSSSFLFICVKSGLM